MGSLNADILRYNADIISATLMIWGKLDENVSWVNTFSISFSYISSFYPIKPSLSSAQYAVAPWLSAHMMLFRGNGCHKCATTLILWGQRQFLGIFRIQQVYMMCMRFFCTIHYLFPFSVQRTYSVAIIWLQEPNSCSWWTQHWKCEVRLSLSLSLNTRWKILEACVNAD